MQSKYFLLTVSDDSYPFKDPNGNYVTDIATGKPALKPWFSHYFRSVEGKVIVRQAKVKMCQDIGDEVLGVLPRVSVTLKEVNTMKDGKSLSFIVMEKVDVLA